MTTLSETSTESTTPLTLLPILPRPETTGTMLRAPSIKTHETTTTVSTEQPFQLQTVGTLPIPGLMHGMVFVNSRLYVLGGATTPGGWTNDVWSARMGEDRLEEWRSEASLPDLRGYITMSVVVAGDYIYVVGGSRYSRRLAPDKEGLPATDILWTKIGKEGILEPWRISPAPPGVSVSCAVACTTKGMLYVLGGSTGTGYSDNVEAADLRADGSLANWRTIAKMPKPLWFHGAGFQDNSLFVWHGLYSGDNKDVNRSVWRADVQADGGLSNWFEHEASENSGYSGMYAVLPNCLVGYGGRLSGGFPVNTIEYARIEGDQITEWNIQPTPIRGRIFAAIAVDSENKRFFVSGGLDKRIPGFTAGLRHPNVSEITMCVWAPQPKSAAVQR